MSSIGTPPMPPLALISSTAISIESLAPWPHSAPLPVSETRQPILTLRPSSLAASALCVDEMKSAMAAAASELANVPERLIVSALPKD